MPFEDHRKGNGGALSVQARHVLSKSFKMAKRQRGKLSAILVDHTVIAYKTPPSRVIGKFRTL
jgi:hypothetical protein